MSRPRLLERLLAGLSLVVSALACSYDFAGAVHCVNGVQDDDETDVDCGGSCVTKSAGRCAYGEHCKRTADCDDGVAACDRERCTPNKLTAWWQPISTQDNMPARFGARLTFYGNEGLLVGGYHKLAGKNAPPAESLGDAWLFTGEWAPEKMGAGARHYHAQAYDETLKMILIAGGQRVGSGHLADTWARTPDNDWQKLSPLPETRVGAAMVHDGTQMLLYGEGDGDEVWMRESTLSADWKRVKTKNPPPVPFWHAMAYDVARQRVVVFGGTDTSYEPNQRTSLLDPATLTWETSEASGPRPRWGAGMAYDSHRQRVVLFGGRASQGRTSRTYNDSWEWNGSAWSKLELIQKDSDVPRKTFHPAFDYDPERRRMVMLVGGQAGFTAVDPPETWALAVLGWPCANDDDCGAGTFCVDKLCCNQACEGGVCNDRDQPGVCKTAP